MNFKNLHRQHTLEDLRKQYGIGDESEDEFDNEPLKSLNDDEKGVIEPSSPTDKEPASPTYQFRRRANIPVHMKNSEQNEVFCLTYTPDSRFLAAGCGDGSVRVYNSVGRLSYHLNASGVSKLPTTCIRFRPATSSSSTKNVMLVAMADGTVSHYHMTSQKCMYTIEEKDNQVYALEYTPDGEYFATAGRDCAVRVYEENTKTLITTMSSGRTKQSTGHSNRVYAIKYKPDEPDVLLSGGWDNTIQIWDVRVGQSVRSIYGPHICGDALDINAEDQILTGSWKPKDALQLWDFGSGQLIQTIEWSRNKQSQPGPQMLYAASFSPDGEYIAAAGSGTNEGRLFSIREDYKPVDRIKMGEHGVFALSFSSNGRKLAFGGAAEDVVVLDLK